MKIQLALDHTSLEMALPVVYQVAQHVDIIEIGTPLLKTAGIFGLRVIRGCFPNHLIVCDSKTMDAGEYEATPFYEAGADICTVLGAADLNTIKGVAQAAHRFDKMAQVDFINVSDKGQLFDDICDIMFGDSYPHIIGIHTGIDQQLAGMTPFRDLANIKSRLANSARLPILKISVAGGIKPTTIPEIIVHDPDIIVVGGAITSAENPAAVAYQIRQMVDLHVRLREQRTVYPIH